jgi:hypothetical protein
MSSPDGIIALVKRTWEQRGAHDALSTLMSFYDTLERDRKRGLASDSLYRDWAPAFENLKEELQDALHSEPTEKVKAEATK